MLEGNLIPGIALVLVFLVVSGVIVCEVLECRDRPNDKAGREKSRPGDTA